MEVLESREAAHLAMAPLFSFIMTSAAGSCFWT